MGSNVDLTLIPSNLEVLLNGILANWKAAQTTASLNTP